MFKSALQRFGRAVVALVLPMALAKYQNNEFYIALTPLLMMGAKMARNKWPYNDFVKMIPF